jgi:hypothetical protein
VQTILGNSQDKPERCSSPGMTRCGALSVDGEQVEGSGPVCGGGAGIAAGGLEAGVAEEFGDDEVCPPASEGGGGAVPEDTGGIPSSSRPSCR